MSMLGQKLKKDFPVFTEHPRLVYLDNAATTQKPRVVIEAVTKHWKRRNANVHRGIYGLSENATAAYEEARMKIAAFIGAPSPRNIIFTRNATESINLVAHAWARRHLKRGDEVLLTLMEHHANVVPWLMLAEERGIKARFADVQIDGSLSIADMQRKTTRRTKLAAFTHASNVLGTINPVKKLTVFFHRRGVPVLIDGAQAVPHFPVNVGGIGCDFYTFSGHKMYAPTGIGVLYVRENIIKSMPPFLGGGEMVRSVTTNGAMYEDAPLRFEAGTPAIEAAIGLGAAVDYLRRVGMRRIRAHERTLTAYALRELRKIPHIAIYGPKNTRKRVGVISFNLRGIHPHDLASLLDAEHICIRAGHHCAMPLHTDTLKVPATCRMSFSVYTDRDDICRAIAALRKTATVFL